MTWYLTLLFLRKRGWQSKLRIFYFFIWLLIVFLSILPAQAELQLGGYWESDLVGMLKKDQSKLLAEVNRLRLKLDANWQEVMTLHLEPRYYSLIKSEDLSLAGVTNPNQLIWDRVYLKGRFPQFSLTLGKQRIAWGVGYVWNPTDVFNPYFLSFAAREEETANVEAVRLEIPLGELSNIDGYVLTNQPWADTTKGVRIKGHKEKFDFSLSYVSQNEGESQVGLDFVGEVFGMGVRGEAAFKKAALVGDYQQLVVGWDYTLENGWGLIMEYFHNGYGFADKNNYDWANNRLGRDYLFLSASKLIDEITSAKGSIIFNLNDASFLLYPQFSRNIKQNLDLNLEAMILGGQVGSEFNPPSFYDPLAMGGSKSILVRLVLSF